MPIDRAIARQHADWLSLMEVSGPFLSMLVLLETFPDGLDLKDNEGELRRRVRLAQEEWLDNQHGNRPEAAIHTQWLRFVLTEVLDIRPDALLEGQQIPADLCYEAKDHGETLRPTLVVRSPFEQKPRLLVQLYPSTQNLNKGIPGKRLTDSPATRMTSLLRNTNTRLGLITNGEHWMLVDAPPNETTGYYSWYTTLWLDEPLTLRAFYSLLGMRRFFSVPEDEQLEAMLTKSALKQQEVTEQLGDQVRHAVGMLVRTLDRLNKDSQGTLLHTVTATELYEAALTVMMRLVFLLSAEERDMLLLGTSLYDQYYAVSTLHKQLREQADQQSEEVLGMRFDAWSRLLAVFRIVYGGVEYVDLRLPAYGGRLFNPDRFPFLEGRAPNTSWRDTPAAPLLIDNRTVLHLLGALQYLQVRVPGGGIEPRRLSFRGLDIEQIGHVYEGLLDHTAKRADTTLLGLLGTGESEPEATLNALEENAHKGEQLLLAYLNELTRRTTSTLQKQMGQTLDKPLERSRLLETCDNKLDLFQRILPYAGLLRKDSFENYMVITPSSVYVTHGDDRRSTGTHYTPRSLTEPIVQHALDPLVYTGPAEGLPEEQWQLHSAAELLELKVCDMAMGSGAFLVQTCRYLSEKLVTAWENAERTLSSNGTTKPQITPNGLPSQGKDGEELLPVDPDERLALARRLVSERCLYGVDKNPMAVEMAKLSLWLTTLAKNRPFTFLDHALRSGDSLLGVHAQQLINWSLDSREGAHQTVWIEPAIKRAVEVALKLRRRLIAMPEYTVRDIEEKSRLLFEAQSAMEVLKLGADILVATALIQDPKQRGFIQDTLHMQYFLLLNQFEQAKEILYHTAIWAKDEDDFHKMRAEVDKFLHGRQPFHWPLEFPEVFTSDQAGFSAIIGNPPFQGGQKITGTLGTDYRDYLVAYLANGKRGSADLCAYFFLRAAGTVQRNGMVALLATNTIAQGDTREVGLDQIVASGSTIPRAVPSRKWPGEASLEVAHIWLRNGKWYGSYILNDRIVKGIASFLTVPRQTSGKSYVLNANANKSFIGSYVLGMGFVLEPEVTHALIAKDARNKDILFPYLNGEDLNSRPDQSPSRWVINFHNWPLEKAEIYTDCMQIVREKVKLERDILGLRDNSSAKGRARLWWHYGRNASSLYSTIADMKRVLAIPLVSKYMICAWEAPDIVYSHALGIIASDSDSGFALIQCTFHNDWARANGSTLETRMRYTPSDCFETFPFPSNMTQLDDIGERYYVHRQAIMLTRQEGLTKTYNRFHNSLEHSQDIVLLRELHREMDEAVAHAYGWDDLSLEHGFHETKQGRRYTISETARREVLDRLLLLNHQRHQEEVAAGLFEKKGAKTGDKGAKKGTKLQARKTVGAAYNAQFIAPTVGATQGPEPIGQDVEQNTLF